MIHTKYDQTLALAGIYQAASLVKQIASTGLANSAHIDTSIETLFRYNASNVEAVYGDIASISYGIKVLQTHLNTANTHDLDITKYVISLIVLAKKLLTQKKQLSLLAEKLKKIEAQFDFFAMNHENTFVKLADIYKELISPLGSKIIVTGNPIHLNNAQNANKIRAILLAGVRSAVLWQQCGGSRWQFLFGRKAYQTEIKKIIRQI